MKRELLVENEGFILPKDTKIINEAIATAIPKASLLITEEGYFMNALLQRAEIENKNGRIYPKPLLEREFSRMMVMIQAGNAVGECDHPEESVVSLKDNPHRIVEMWWDGNDLYGKLQLLVSRPYRENGTICNKADQIAMLIEDYGVNIGISSRGVGSLKKIRGKNYVQDDFELLCWDLVHSPSTHNAYLYSQTPLQFENKKNEGNIISEGKVNKYKKFII